MTKCLQTLDQNMVEMVAAIGAHSLSWARARRKYVFFTISFVYIIKFFLHVAQLVRLVR